MYYYANVALISIIIMIINFVYLQEKARLILEIEGHGRVSSGVDNRM